MKRPVFQTWSVLLLAVALLAGGCATVRPVPRAFSAEQRVVHNGKVFASAWDLVSEKFFDEKFRGVDWTAMRERYRPEAAKTADDDALYTVINTMLAELRESHLAALAPQEAFDIRTKQRALVGLRFQLVENQWVVTRVFPGSPAEAAGVRPGWLAVRRDGKPLGEDGFRLKEGQTVGYEFLDAADELHALTMTARVISTEFAPESLELDGAVYLRFDDFTLQSLRWLSAQLRAHRKTPAVVIDLRDNPGGLLLSLDFALGEFFSKPVAMGTFVRRSGSRRNEVASQWFSANYPGRVVLLVGPGSASCAEIFAHVLRHHGRAVIVGQKTAGAVIAAREYALPDGGRLQVPVADYVGLDGQRIEGAGVRPDVEVPVKTAELRAGIDAELAAALSQLRQPAAPLAQIR